MIKTPGVLVLSLALPVFAALQTVGLSLAAHKHLWGDELHTQRYSINASYSDLLLGHNKEEGNTAPLFYVPQKILCDLFRFQTPDSWLQGQWQYTYPFADVFLRTLPVLWMSSFFLLVFIYFARRFNLLLGVFGLLTALSSPALWWHWAEARPYGLWALLTGLQMFLFLDILREKNKINRRWHYLSAVHILLSLTCALSIFQIVIVCAMLLFKERRWLQYIFLLGVPLIFIYFYKPHTQEVIFISSVTELMLSAVPLNHLAILLLYPLLLRVYLLPNQKMIPLEEIKKVFPFFLAILLMITAIFLFLTTLHNHATAQGQYVVERHIVFLVPVSIIGITYLSGLLWNSLKLHGWMRNSALAMVAALFGLGLHASWQEIYNFVAQ